MQTMTSNPTPAPAAPPAPTTQAVQPSGLPAPTGPYPVGRTVVDLVDDERRDPYTRRDQHRRVTTWVWYPATDGSGANETSYLPGLWRLQALMFGVRAGQVDVHARDGARPASMPGGFPLVVLSPTVNPPLGYTALAEELASHGFVVAGVAHTYSTMPFSVDAHGVPHFVRARALGGALRTAGSRSYQRDLTERDALVQVMADDIVFVARELRLRGPAPWGEVDVAPWAAIGHSFGGAAAVRASAIDATCRAAVNLDGALWTGPASITGTGPVLQLFAEHPEFVVPVDDAVAQSFYKNTVYARRDRDTTVQGWDALHGASSAGHAALVSGATHTSFQDWPMVPCWDWSPARRSLAGVSGPRVLRVVATATRTFLDHHVRGEDIDVAFALDADPALRTGSPASLFSSDRLGGS
jgi:predicted dienelactone hydrolase